MGNSESSEMTADGVPKVIQWQLDADYKHPNRKHIHLPAKAPMLQPPSDAKERKGSWLHPHDDGAYISRTDEDQDEQLYYSCIGESTDHDYPLWCEEPDDDEDDDASAYINLATDRESQSTATTDYDSAGFLTGASECESGESEQDDLASPSSNNSKNASARWQANHSAPSSRSTTPRDENSSATTTAPSTTSTTTATGTWSSASIASASSGTTSGDGTNVVCDRRSLTTAEKIAAAEALMAVTYTSASISKPLPLARATSSVLPATAASTTSPLAVLQRVPSTPVPAQQHSQLAPLTRSSSAVLALNDNNQRISTPKKSAKPIPLDHSHTSAASPNPKQLMGFIPTETTLPADMTTCLLR
jgi:hypothetical protein